MEEYAGVPEQAAPAATLLLVACEQGDLSTVRKLIDGGVDLHTAVKHTPPFAGSFPMISCGAARRRGNWVG
jgi:hypothetical protein